jgi:hypothetical protein
LVITTAQKVSSVNCIFKPVENWNVYLNYIGSNEANSDDSLGIQPDAFYQVFDLTTSFQITEKFLLGLNAAYGSQKGDYQGAADLLIRSLGVV